MHATFPSTQEQVHAAISAAPNGLTLSEIVGKIQLGPVNNPHVAVRSALTRLRLNGRAAVANFADGTRRWRAA